jgi:hypothetical protein
MTGSDLGRSWSDERHRRTAGANRRDRGPGHRGLVRDRCRHRPDAGRPGDDRCPGGPPGGPPGGGAGGMPEHRAGLTGLAGRSVRSRAGRRPGPVHLGRPRRSGRTGQQRRGSPTPAGPATDPGRGGAGHDHQLPVPGGDDPGPPPGHVGTRPGHHRERVEPRGTVGHRHRGGLLRLEVRPGRLERVAGRRPRRHRRAGATGPARGHRHRDLGPARQRPSPLLRSAGPGRRSGLGHRGLPDQPVVRALPPRPQGGGRDEDGRLRRLRGRDAGHGRRAGGRRHRVRWQSSQPPSKEH